jgi:Na+/melibiose symporter-like transporter
MNERGVITASILVPLGLIAGGVAGYWVYKRNKKRMHATISKRLKQKKEEDFDEDLPNRVGGKRRTHRRRR